MNAWASIPALDLGMDRGHFDVQTGRIEGALTLPIEPPCIGGASGYIECSANRENRHLRFVGEPEHVCGHDVPSRAKKDIARLRISRSWRSVWTSRRSAESSSRSGVVRVPVFELAASACA